MPLSSLKISQTAYIQKIILHKKIKQFISSLGFVELEPITIISKNNKYLIVKIKNSRIAINSEISNYIIVTPLN